jgi:hypothetical protein
MQAITTNEGRDGFKVRIKTFLGRLEPGALDDINDVTVEHLRSIPSSQFGLIEEYDITIRGDKERVRIIQNAIVQTIRRNTQGRRALVFLANRIQ